MSDSESGSTTPRRPLIRCVEVSRDDPGQCNRVIDKYKLIGKFTLVDIAYRALEVIRRETVSISYIGLTSLSPYQRMHTHSAAHFPNKGRSIFWICTARSDIMRVAEGKLVQILRQHHVRLQNSYSSSLSGAGIDARSIDAMIDLYLLSDYFNGHCSCHFCTRWSIRIHDLKCNKRIGIDDDDEEEEHTEGHSHHYYWFKKPLEETQAAGEVPLRTKRLRSDDPPGDHEAGGSEVPVTTKRARSDDPHGDHEAGGILVASKQTIDSHHRDHDEEASMLARRLVQEQQVENYIDETAKQGNAKDNNDDDDDRWMKILEGNFEKEDNDKDSVDVQPTEIDDSTSEETTTHGAQPTSK